MARSTESEVTLNTPYGAWFGVAVAATVLFVIGHDWIPIPFEFWDLWVQHGSIMAGLQSVWFLFAWGAGATMFLGIIAIIKRTPRGAAPGAIFLNGLWMSVHAGILEEIVYRFFRFILAMFGLMVGNFLTFGLLEWIYTSWFIPVANWATFGALAPQLTDASVWILAGAVISANNSFKDGHAYLGWFGFVNSWFLGMVFFYLMFNYGLWTAIVAHIVYDLCVFTMSAITAVFRPAPSPALNKLVRVMLGYAE